MIGQRPKKIGRYQIIDEVGRGQMGVVYKAQDPIMGRVVAVKVVHVGEFSQPDVLRDCLRSEAKLAGKLAHPSIVTIYDAGEDAGTGDLFIVMEYLRGPTLRELMDSRVFIRQAIHVALQLCDALDYAHKQGMVHGDLTPSNVKVLDKLQVKITDFGLAGSIQASSRAGTFTGTLVYASPEQLRGGQIDGRSDIFSLGVSLFEMLAGVRPFADEDLHRDKPVQERLECIPSRFLRGVLLRALTQDPDQRYSTGAALADDLRRYQEGDTSIITENPFIVGSPITEPQYFCGRKREIRAIVSRLKGATPGSSAIIGGRRIGKTSLLRMLCHPHFVEEQGFTDEYIFVRIYRRFISAREGQFSTIESQLWKSVLQGMSEQMHPRFSGDTLPVLLIDEDLRKDHITFADLKKVFAATCAAGLKVVLLFDEFQNIVSNEVFSPSLFGGLRDLAQSYNLAFITASGKNLQSLSKRQEIATSPLWNIFINVYLENFSEDEARDLVTSYNRRTDISLNAEDFDYIMYISGGHPYFLQLACWCVFDAYREGEWGRGADYEKAKQGLEEEFSKQAEPHFAHFWEQSSPVERRVLITLAYGISEYRHRDSHQEQPMLQIGPGLKALSERSLVIKADSGNYRVFSPLFAEWIRQQVEANSDDVLELHFQYFWEQAEKDERRALLILASQVRGRGLVAPTSARQYKGLSDQAGSALDALMRWGLVIRTDEGNYEIFTPLFSHWILSREGDLRDRVALVLKKAPDWFRKAGAMLMASLLVLLIVLPTALIWPDLRELRMKVLKLDNVTPIAGLTDSSGKEVRVEVYSPPLLLVGEEGSIEMQVYGPEKPRLQVTCGSPGVVITESGDFFKMKCKGTDANMFSRSEFIELRIKATMPGGSSAIAAVPVKTNYVLSLFVRVGFLLVSAMVIGGLSAKELLDRLRSLGRKVQAREGFDAERGKSAAKVKSE